jgi:hypothetical protein
VTGLCADCQHFDPVSPWSGYGVCRFTATFRGGGPHYGECKALPMRSDKKIQVTPEMIMAVAPDFGCVQFRAPAPE